MYESNSFSEHCYEPGELLYRGHPPLRVCGCLRGGATVLKPTQLSLKFISGGCTFATFKQVQFVLVTYTWLQLTEKVKLKLAQEKGGDLLAHGIQTIGS